MKKPLTYTDDTGEEFLGYSVKNVDQMVRQNRMIAVSLLVLAIAMLLLVSFIIYMSWYVSQHNVLTNILRYIWETKPCVPIV